MKKTIILNKNELIIYLNGSADYDELKTLLMGIYYLEMKYNIQKIIFNDRHFNDIVSLKKEFDNLYFSNCQL